MSLKSETVQVYNWFDIQKEICNRMGITEHQFYSYHEVVKEGKDYKNLWHVALETIVPSQMQNDTTVRIFAMFDEPFTKEDIKENWEDIIDKYGDWCVEFLYQAEKLLQEIDVDNNGVYVKFSW